MALPSPMPSAPPMVVEADRLYGLPVNRYFTNVTMNEMRALDIAGYDDDEIGEILYMAYVLGQPVTSVSRWRDLSYGNLHVMAVDLGLNPERVEEAGDRLEPYVRAMLDEWQAQRRLTRRLRQQEAVAGARQMRYEEELRMRDEEMRRMRDEEMRRMRDEEMRRSEMMRQQEAVAGERQVLPPSTDMMPMSGMEAMHRERIYGVPADQYFRNVPMTDLQALDAAGYDDDEIGEILYMAYHLGQPVTTISRWRDVTYGGNLNTMALETGLNATRVQEVGDRLAPHVRMMLDRSREMRMR